MNLINSKEEIDRDKYQGLRDYKIKYGNRNKASQGIKLRKKKILRLTPPVNQGQKITNFNVYRPWARGFNADSVTLLDYIVIEMERV